MSKTLNLIYFAWIRQEIGHGQEAFTVDDAVTDVGSLIQVLVAKSASYTKAFAQADKLRCAVNQEFAEFDHLLKDGDEVAFFPPVTGG